MIRVTQVHRDQRWIRVTHDLKVHKGYKELRVDGHDGSQGPKGDKGDQLARFKRSEG